VSLCTEATLKIKVALLSDSKLNGESGLTWRDPFVMFI